ncbi:hypothetical protein D3C79_1086340 [compost metagenome]
MDVLPVHVVLSVLHDRQINLTELLTNGAKVRAVARIAAVEHFFLWGNKHKAAPQGLVAFQSTTGKMARGQHVYG